MLLQSILRNLERLLPKLRTGVRQRNDGGTSNHINRTVDLERSNFVIDCHNAIGAWELQQQPHNRQLRLHYYHHSHNHDIFLHH